MEPTYRRRSSRPRATEGDRRSRALKTVLVVGLFALAAAALVAHLSPATGYELSIYRATPAVFWVALGLAFVASVVVGLAARGVARAAALCLGGGSTVLLAALPLVRGYFYLGKEDALTHIGYARDIMQGRLDLANMIYPAMHTFSVVLDALSGRAIPGMLLLVVPIFVGLFVAFVPLCVRVLTDRRRLDPIAVLAAALVLAVVVIYLPVLQPVSTSEAALFVPVATFVFLAYLTRRRSVVFGALFLSVVVFLLLLHPQQALVFVGLFVVVLLVYPLARVLAGDADGLSSVVPGLVRFLAVAVPGVVVLGWWIATHPPTAQIASLESRLFGVDSTAALETFLSTHGLGAILAAVTRNVSPFAIPQASTVEALGVSPETVYRRVLGIRVVYAVFALGALFVPLLARVARRSADRFDRPAERAGAAGVRYPLVVAVVCGLFPAAAIIALYVLAGVPNQYFRYLGFVLVIVTVLAAVFLREAHTALSAAVSPTAAHAVLAVVLVVSVAVATPVVFRSPYVYQPTEDISHAQVSGYGTTFTEADPGIPIAGVDAAAFRYRDAIYGSKVSRQGIGMAPADTLDSPFDNARSAGIYSRAPPHFANGSLPERIDEPVYLTVTASDREASTRLFEGTEFSRVDFAALSTTPGIAKVASTGGFDLYLVTPTNDSNATDAG